MLFSSRVRYRIRVRSRLSVWLVSCYAHVFVLVSIVIVTLPPVDVGTWCWQGLELGRHWRRHSVQDADGCYSCAACSFTSNVRLIMQSHTHVHLMRRRCAATSLPTAGPRCRLCGKCRRRVWKTADDGRLTRSLWCSECCQRLAASRLAKMACLRRTRRQAKSLRRRRFGRVVPKSALAAADIEAFQSCDS